MKKLLLLCMLLLSSCMLTTAQTVTLVPEPCLGDSCVYTFYDSPRYYKAPIVHTLYISALPTDFGLGLRYDITFGVIGAYASWSYGNYYIYDKTNYIKDHQKFTLGLLVPMPDQLQQPQHFYLTAGLNYHIWGDVQLNGIQLNPKIFNPWSFELGFTYSVHHFALGCRTDILRWEPCIDIGYNF
jgi:hypothetical protein